MPGRYFALLACLTIMIMAGCGMNKSEKTINKKLNKFKPDEIANVEFAYITYKGALFRIDAPPLRRKVSSSNYSSLCDALQKARAESETEQVGIGRTNPLALEIQVKEGVEEKMIILFVDGHFFELRVPSNDGETIGVRFYCRELMDWAACYQADMDMEFLAYLGEVQPDFSAGTPFDQLIWRLGKALPFYDFSGYGYGRETLFAKDFAEWYKNNKDKLVWDDKAKHYAIGN